MVRLRELVADCSSQAPLVRLEEEDDAAIYFSSGTTGFPKAILHRHKALVCSCITEQRRWYDAIENDTDPVVLPEQACVVSEILEAIYTSARTGKPVYFD